LVVTWPFRDARGRDESNATNYARPEITHDLAPVTGFARSCNHNKLRKTDSRYLFVPRRFGKSGTTVQGLDRNGSSRHG
jgi:hypothetical protein